MSEVRLPGAIPGTVYLVGAGPGDPGLLTLRAAELLRTCDLVAYDRLVAREILDLVPGSAERLGVGKRRGGRGWSQSEIERVLVGAARAGRAVVRLKGGDPFVFGRGGEELAACRAAGVPCEVVPGVTSAFAAPAAAGIPVTQRGVAGGVAVVAAQREPGGTAAVITPALAAFPGTLVLLMGVGSAGEVAAQLIAHGRDPATPVAVVCSATTARERVVETRLEALGDAVRERAIAPPATIVIGDVVRLRHLLAARDVTDPQALAAALA